MKNFVVLFLFYVQSSFATMSCVDVLRGSAESKVLLSVYSHEPAIRGVAIQGQAKNESYSKLVELLRQAKELDQKKSETSSQRPFWAKIISVVTLGQLVVGPYHGKILELRHKQWELRRSVNAKRNTYKANLHQYDRMRLSAVREVNQTMKTKSEDLTVFMTDHIRKSLKEEYRSDVSISQPSGLTLNSVDGVASQWFVISLNIFGEVVSAKVRVSVGIKANASGAMTLFSFIAEQSTSSNRQYYETFINEIFRRRTVFSSKGGTKKAYNTELSLEARFERLGYNIKNPKTLELIQGIRQKALQNVKSGYEAMRLVEKAESAYPAGMDSSQMNLFNSYLWYYATGNSSTMYYPPFHWMLFHLNQPSETHSTISNIFEKAAQQSNSSDQAISRKEFDGIVEKTDPSIITIQDAVSSPEYKSALQESNLADVLGINEATDLNRDLTVSNDINLGGSVEVTGGGTVDLPTASDTGSSYSAPSSMD